jgi:hypothetical protein
MMDENKRQAKKDEAKRIKKEKCLCVCVVVYKYIHVVWLELLELLLAVACLL